MKLSLAQAATVLGKSERQVRYLIKTGQIPAVKVSGRWQVEDTALPLSAEKKQAIALRVEAARASFDKAIAPAKAATKSVYSVTNLVAFRCGHELYRELEKESPDDPALALLFTSLEEITRGCHSFHPREKCRHYLEARGKIATVLTHLLLAGRTQLAKRLESELLPKLSGLIAGCERRSRRHRKPEHSGALTKLLEATS